MRLSVFNKAIGVIGALLLSTTNVHAEYQEISKMGCQKSAFFQELKLSENQKEKLLWWHLDQIPEEQKKDVEKMKKQVQSQLEQRERLLWSWFCEQPLSESDESLVKWKSASIAFDQIAQNKLERIKNEITEKELQEDFQVQYPKKLYVDLLLGVYKKEADAKRVLKRVKEGDALSELAKQSDIPTVAQKEGRVGFILQEELPKGLQSPLLKMQVGEVASQVIATQEGFAVMQLLDKKMEAEKEFLEVRTLLRERRAQMLLEAMIRKELTSK